MDTSASACTSARRLEALAAHLQQRRRRSTSQLLRQPTAAETGFAAALDPPVVAATRELSTNPFKFLLNAAAENPDIFVVSRPGFEFIVPSDVSMFEARSGRSLRPRCSFYLAAAFTSLQLLPRTTFPGERL